MLYICTEFHENISKGFRVTELTQFLIYKFSKGHHSIKNIGGIMVLVLCYCLMKLYICIKFQENIKRVSELLTA